MADCRVCKRIRDFMDDWQKVAETEEKILNRIETAMSHNCNARFLLDILFMIRHDIESLRENC